jgi:flagella basal body P-ring formation protein FlgA
MRFPNSITIYFTVILLTASWPVSSHAADIIYGKDIKDQASKFFNEIGLNAEILTSNKRAFFKCSEDLEFKPHVQNDWRTVQAKCKSENWQSILRTTALAPSEVTTTIQNMSASSQVVSIVNNMSKGQVLSGDDLALVSAPDRNVFSGFKKINELIGRKVTRNLAKGTILKARHVKFRLNVNKNDTVLVILGNNKLSITTYGIALTSGQKGDMITVENLKSNKKFKAIVLGEKKVAPLTNM